MALRTHSRGRRAGLLDLHLQRVSSLRGHARDLCGACAGKPLAALELTYESLRRLRDEGISHEELEMNRQQLKGNMLMALESTSTRMSRMAKSLIHHARIVSVDEIIQRLDAVTEAGVQSYARKAFQPPALQSPCLVR